uniref:TF-B3 domain-containing protein n=1 Tax=Manihot esculenta TaxID=3983 RepID=A0A2C9U3B5_MANES
MEKLDYFHVFGAQKSMKDQALVKDHILPFMSSETLEKIRGEGAKFCFWDCDTKTQLNVALKDWHTSKSYIFKKGWLNTFVKRRNLVKGDLIGIY